MTEAPSTRRVERMPKQWRVFARRLVNTVGNNLEQIKDSTVAPLLKMMTPQGLSALQCRELDGIVQGVPALEHPEMDAFIDDLLGP